MSERISREELVRIYNVEITFFDSLEEAGLLTTETEDDIKYLQYDDLSAFEKFTNWYYDLEVNLAGLEVINHLLSQIEKMRRENERISKLI
ncbi:MerR family transcriptional regulator [Kaistella flava (ex Peng et al. 2021)]|uniref:MerR family transcriptional regulator n=1 Tax=Kaistella flava (ex Peng et al. 2021) TaxID=2038776 RepID=A0A7M2YDQ8_9FLAO|nr:chaperone modulator CbpM [Kaistella flava (ex Peng et al. 2021)]QOW11785.1 MerR family transcriptional regulator [Kaistella flava (ex Peng et al. 2021)]